MKRTEMQKELIKSLKKVSNDKDFYVYCSYGLNDNECETMIGFIEGALEDGEKVTKSDMLLMKVYMDNQRAKQEGVEKRFYELNPSLKGNDNGD